MVLRRVKDRARNKFNLAIAEVGDNDRWQRAQLGISVVGNDRRFVESALDEIIRFMQSEVEIVDVEREIPTFGDRFGKNELEFGLP